MTGRNCLPPACTGESLGALLSTRKRHGATAQDMSANVMLCRHGYAVPCRPYFFLATGIAVRQGFGAGANLDNELALLVEAGFSPMEALQAATLNPAKFLGKTHYSLASMRAQSHHLSCSLRTPVSTKPWS